MAPQSDESDDTRSSDDSDRRFKRNEKRAKVGDEAAQQAAACGGLFVNVEYPLIREAYLSDYGLVTIYQKKSPYYFKGRTKALPDGTKPKLALLKVWNLEEVDEEDVQREWENYRQALKAGVPVVAPVLDELVRSKSLSGSEYLVMAVECLSVDTIDTDEELFQFCTLSIEAVKKLHEDAGLLHCDLKPGNIFWNDGVVKLNDFGHSQKITNAVRSRGTKGFEAPEVLKRMPCSTKTDAFSVGAFFLQVFETLDEEDRKNRPYSSLHDMAKKLTDSDPDTRWSLTQALQEVQRIQSSECGNDLL